MQTYQTGDSLIFKVPEREISLQPAALYPEAFPVAEAVIQPIALSIHSWVVQTPYDLIVIDPPTISRSKKMEGMFDIQNDYPFLISQGLRLLKEGGTLFFSTNSRKQVTKSWAGCLCRE